MEYFLNRDSQEAACEDVSETPHIDSASDGCRSRRGATRLYANGAFCAALWITQLSGLIQGSKWGRGTQGEPR